MNDTDEIGKFAAMLSCIEIGLGSFLHGLKIPFSGTVLSLNQIFILSYASIKISSLKSPSYISISSAILKSLSPAGKKLTPMLAISLQGLLFNLGLFIFGNNFIGRVLGAAMASSWSLIQPFLIYLVLFGEDLLFILQYFEKKFLTHLPGQSITIVVLSFFLLKGLIAIIMVIFSHKINERNFKAYLQWSRNIKPTFKQAPSAFKGAIKDVTHPLFIGSILLVSVFYFYAKSSWSIILWKSLRPLACGFIIFYLVRKFPIDWVLSRIKSPRLKAVIAKAHQEVAKY